MQMHYIRDELSVFADLHRRLREQGIAKSIVGIFCAAMVVDAGTAKETFVLNEPHRHFSIEHSALYADPVFFSLAHVHARRTLRSNAVFSAIDRAVERQNNAYLVAQPAQGFRQSSDH